jgi:hypothetical protein
MAEFKIHNLWPIPVYQSNIETKKEWKDLILDLYYERTHIGNSDISKDRFILDRMPDLKSQINLHCENYVKKYLKVKKEASFYLLNSWVNIHRPNDQAQVHQHGNALLSGVYYPIVPTAERYEIEVENDLIIIFPSHLEHSVQRNISNKNRYSLAFNYYVRGEFGREEYKLEIK